MTKESLHKTMIEPLSFYNTLVHFNPHELPDRTKIIETANALHETTCEEIEKTLATFPTGKFGDFVCEQFSPINSRNAPYLIAAQKPRYWKKPQQYGTDYTRNLWWLHFNAEQTWSSEYQPELMVELIEHLEKIDKKIIRELLINIALSLSSGQIRLSHLWMSLDNAHHHFQDTLALLQDLQTMQDCEDERQTNHYWRIWHLLRIQQHNTDALKPIAQATL